MFNKVIWPVKLDFSGLEWKPRAPMCGSFISHLHLDRHMQFNNCTQNVNATSNVVPREWSSSHIENNKK